MQWFDAIFRSMGSLLPMLPWALRCGPLIKSSNRASFRSTLPWGCFLAYTCIGLVRVILYLAHLALQRGHLLAPGGTSKEPWVSDHVFLAASVVACLQVFFWGGAGVTDQNLLSQSYQALHWT